jgi:predicted nucleotidyltransferase
MNRAETLALLSRHKPEMQRRFGVRSLALFGSRARTVARRQ